MSDSELRMSMKASRIDDWTAAELGAETYLTEPTAANCRLGPCRDRRRCARNIELEKPQWQNQVGKSELV